MSSDASESPACTRCAPASRQALAKRLDASAARSINRCKARSSGPPGRWSASASSIRNCSVPIRCEARENGPVPGARMPTWPPVISARPTDRLQIHRHAAFLARVRQAKSGDVLQVLHRRGLERWGAIIVMLHLGAEALGNVVIVRLGDHGILAIDLPGSKLGLGHKAARATNTGQSAHRLRGPRGCPCKAPRAQRQAFASRAARKMRSREVMGKSRGRSTPAYLDWIPLLTGRAAHLLDVRHDRRVHGFPCLGRDRVRTGEVVEDLLRAGQRVVGGIDAGRRTCRVNETDGDDARRSGRAWRSSRRRSSARLRASWDRAPLADWPGTAANR